MKYIKENLVICVLQSSLGYKILFHLKRQIRLLVHSFYNGARVQEICTFFN